MHSSVQKLSTFASDIQTNKGGARQTDLSKYMQLTSLLQFYEVIIVYLCKLMQILKLHKLI